MKPPPGGAGDQEIDLARLVLAERHDRQVAVADRPVGDDPPFLLVVAQRPDLAGDVVGVEVVALQLRQPLAAVDVAAGDRLADVVVVLPDRVDQVLARRRRRRRRTGAAPRGRFQP